MQPDMPTPEDLLAQADIALYRAKEEGRDQYRFHTEELDIQVREQVAISEELTWRSAATNSGFYYQPQVELSTNRIVGMEALIRWNHPKRGLLYPSAFISIAETNRRDESDRPMGAGPCLPANEYMAEG